MSVMNYVAHLPEVGDPLLKELEAIIEMEREANRLLAVRRKLERELSKEVAKLWTDRERATAKAMYRETCRTPK